MTNHNQTIIWPNKHVNDLSTSTFPQQFGCNPGTEASATRRHTQQCKSWYTGHLCICFTRPPLYIVAALIHNDPVHVCNILWSEHRYLYVLWPTCNTSHPRCWNTLNILLKKYLKPSPCIIIIYAPTSRWDFHQRFIGIGDGVRPKRKVWWNILLDYCAIQTEIILLLTRMFVMFMPLFYSTFLLFEQPKVS